MWSRKFEKCQHCGTTDTSHIAKGLCKKCYIAHTERKHKEAVKTKGSAKITLTRELLQTLYIDQELSLSEIGKIVGYSRVNVHHKLKHFGIEARSKTDARTLALDRGKIKTNRFDATGNEEEITFQKIRYNQHFFKTWSPEMAYVLGLIYTDGNLHIRKARSGYEIGILTFAQKERELVEKFLNLLECNATIRFREKRKSDKSVAGELYYFSIGNNDIANDLLNIGLTPNKSLTMQFPNVSSEYLRHFVRGLFDGDGSVYIESNGFIRVKLLSGSKDFVCALNQLLINEGFSSRTIYGGTASTPNSYFIRYNSRVEVLRFYKYLYEDISDSMLYSRKKRIFEEYFDLTKMSYN